MQDYHFCFYVSNRSSTSHFTKMIVLLIFPKSEPGQLQTVYATAWKTTKDITWEIVIRRNAHAAVHLRMINQFQEYVLFTYINNSQYTNCIYDMYIIDTCNGPKSQPNLNSLARRAETFNTFFVFCRRLNLQIEHWDVLFCHGSFEL